MATQYKPFLIQKLTDNAPVLDSQEWGIWVKSIPFKLFPDIKEIPSKNYYDEHGDSEFVPIKPYYKAYEIECKFIFIGKTGTANNQIKSFLRYLAEGGMFRFYDEYTKIGRTNVRYVKVDDDPDVFFRREGENDIVQFKVTLKVNDPITDITLTK